MTQTTDKDLISYINSHLEMGSRTKYQIFMLINLFKPESEKISKVKYNQLYKQALKSL